MPTEVDIEDDIDEGVDDGIEDDIDEGIEDDIDEGIEDDIEDGIEDKDDDTDEGIEEDIEEDVEEVLEDKGTVSDKDTHIKVEEISEGLGMAHMGSTDTKRMNVILDLDNTIICAEPTTEFPFREKGIRDKALKYTIHNIDDYYICFERPNSQTFLDYVFANFNVSVWTSATKSYMLFIVDNVLLADSKRQLDYVFFSYHCNISEHKCNGIKDLSLLWNVFELPGYEPTNTLIIDDLEEVHKLNECNCINVKPFEILDELKNQDKPDFKMDDELLRVKDKLEKIKATRNPCLVQT